MGRLAVLRAATSPFRAGVFIGTAILRRETPARDRTVDEGRVPLGADFAFVLPTPIVTLAPWVAPRIQYTGGSGPTAAARGTHAAFATGVELELPNGLGFRLAYDRVLLTGDDEATFGIGLSYSFQPGL
jgi:hypothetical protein